MNSGEFFLEPPVKKQIGDKMNSAARSKTKSWKICNRIVKIENEMMTGDDDFHHKRVSTSDNLVILSSKFS